MVNDKGKTIRTVGWIVVGVGLFVVGLGVRHADVDFNQKDDILDAEFKVVEE